MQFFTIFQHLDEPKRYSGATLFEIAVVGIIVSVAFALQYLAAGLFIGLIAFRVIRAISRSSKVSYYKRWIWLHSQDLKAGPNKSKRYFF
jgi:hypothetical protein